MIVGESYVYVFSDLHYLLLVPCRGIEIAARCFPRARLHRAVYTGQKYIQRGVVQMPELPLEAEMKERSSVLRCRVWCFLRRVSKYCWVGWKLEVSGG